MDPENVVNPTPAAIEEPASSPAVEPQPTGGEPAQPEPTPEPGTGEPTPEPTPEPSGPEPETGAEKRIKQLVAKSHDAEREAAYWKGVAEGRLNKDGTPVQTPAAKQEGLPPVAPQVNDYETYAEYEAAREDYVLKMADYRADQRIAAKVAADKAQEAAQKFTQRIEEEAKANPAVLEATKDATLPVSDVMAALIQESEVGPKVLLYLSENRDEAKRIYGLHPVLAAKEIGRIEAKCLTPKPVTQTNKISQAPEPVTTVGGRGTPSVDLDTIPIDEFMKKRNREEFGKR
jgi:hypothetical protein